MTFFKFKNINIIITTLFSRINMVWELLKEHTSSCFVTANVRNVGIMGTYFTAGYRTHLTDD
jgi:hypothetical protein